MKDIINTRCGWAGTDELYIKYHDENGAGLLPMIKHYLNFWFLKVPKPDWHGLPFSENEKDTKKLFITLT